MGPRSIDRGTDNQKMKKKKVEKLQWGPDRSVPELQLFRRRGPGDFQASMGPRSIDRGTAGVSGSGNLTFPASMGPRSIDRGTKDFWRNHGLDRDASMG